MIFNHLNWNPSKKVTIILEDDDTPKAKSKEADKEKSGGGGGGRGAREVKTKGKDKKRKKKEAQEAAEEDEKKKSEGALQEEEIDSGLQDDEVFETLDDESRQTLVDLLLPVLSGMRMIFLLLYWPFSWKQIYYSFTLKEWIYIQYKPNTKKRQLQYLHQNKNQNDRQRKRDAKKRNLSMSVLQSHGFKLLRSLGSHNVNNALALPYNCRAHL